MSLLGDVVSEYLADHHHEWNRLQYYDDEISICKLSRSLWISIYTKPQKIRPAVLPNNIRLPAIYYNDDDFLQKLSFAITMVENADSNRPL